MGKNTGKNKRDGKNTEAKVVEAKVAEVVEVAEVQGPRPSKDLKDTLVFETVHFVNKADETKTDQTHIPVWVQADGTGRIVVNRSGNPLRMEGGGERVIRKVLGGLDTGKYLPSDWRADFGEGGEITLQADCLDWLGLDSAERVNKDGTKVTHWRLANEEEQVALRAKASSRNRFAAELAKLRRPDAALQAAPVIVPTVAAEPVISREDLKAEIMAEIAAEAEALAKAEAEALALVEAEAAKEQELTDLKATVADMMAMMAVMKEAMAAAK